jgi:hypothetical protein
MKTRGIVKDVRAIDGFFDEVLPHDTTWLALIIMM